LIPVPTLFLYTILYGFVYSIFAVGFALIFGVAKVANVAHGAFYTIAAYLYYVLWLKAGLSPVAAAVACLPPTALTGVLVGELTIRPVLKAPVSVFVTTLAASAVIEEVVRILFSTNPLPVPTIRGSYSFLGVYVPKAGILVVALGLAAVALLTLLLDKTMLGLFIRATAESWDEVRIIGGDPLRVFRVSMALSALYAGIAAVLLSPLEMAITPYGGSLQLLKAFAIVILGGLGSIAGSIAASFIFSFIEQAVSFLFMANYAYIAPLILVVIMLVIRPRGLFGEEA